MRTFALLVFAAVAFSVLTGVIEVALARRARRQVLQHSSLVLHPLTRHELPRLRRSRVRRSMQYVVRFVGFLLAVCLGMLVVKAVRGLLAHWF